VNRLRGKIIRHLRLDEENVFVVPNGVDFEAIRRLARRANRAFHRLAYVGRIVKYKKVEQVLELILRLRKLGLDAKADIVGDGPERSRLDLLTSKMRISSNVRFWGFVCGRSLWPRVQPAPSLQDSEQDPSPELLEIANELESEKEEYWLSTLAPNETRTLG
jgi:glycosyltransferase involved in cell wall biosynthesis